MLVIIYWNVPGELHNPKYMTLGLNNLLFVKKTAFYLLSSFIHMLLYSQIKSSLLKYFAFFNLMITSLISGNGILSLIVY